MHIGSLCFIYIVFIIVNVVAEEQEPKIITSQMVRNQGEYYLTLVLGKPPQKVQLRVDQTLSYTWTTFSWYTKEDSLTYRLSFKTTLDLDNDNSSALAEEIIDQAQFPSNAYVIDNYTFYLVDYESKKNLPRNGFAFGYKYKNDQFSIVHLLYQQRKIDHLAYGFHLSKEKYRVVYGQLYLGGIPQQEIIGKQMGKCKVSLNHNHWGCDLSKIFIENMTNTDVYYNNTAEVIFQIGDERIIAPDNFIQFLSETVFKEYIDERKCIYHNSTSSKYFDCYYGVIGKLPKLHFSFSNFAIVINLNELWWIDEFYCEFLIKSSNQKKSNNWIFGSLFMINKLLLFDYEKNEISVYSDKDIIVYDSMKNNDYKKSILCFYIISLFFGILGCLIQIIIKLKILG